MWHKTLVLAFVIGLSGCAILQPGSDEQVVQDKAERRMAALQALDFHKAYAYMTPGYRAVNSLNTFAGRHAGAASMTGFTVNSPQCEMERCTVVVTRRYKAALPIQGRRDQAVELENNTKQVWIKSDGKWWYYGVE